MSAGTGAATRGNSGVQFAKNAAVLLLLSAVWLGGCTSTRGGGHSGQGDHSAFMATGSGSGESIATGISSGISMPWIATKNTTRINTASPVEAAVLVSRTLWPAQSKASRPGAVILADPTDWASAAAAAHLIHHPHNGPVLYVTGESIPSATLQELQRLQPTGVKGSGVQVILTGKLEAGVEQAAEELGFKTTRVEGGNAAELAAAADAYFIQSAGEISEGVIIGSSDEEAFTMPAAYWSAHMPEPLLYVSGDRIPIATVQALQKRGGKASIYIIGPEKAVSAKLEEELSAYGNVTRISGKDAYENAIAFAKFKDNSTGFGWGVNEPGRNLTLSNVETPQLALAGAPFAHLGKHAPLIWTSKNAMPGSVMEYVMSLQTKYEQSPADGPFNHAWLLGGTAQLTEAAQGELDAMLEISSASSASDGGHGGH
ncbi:ArsR family transcriptional regulator [Paenibacillus herberti]|uniref:ArsR family transcriptional regulator n=2 Tax=Paenibacillus herberti TaxID=1619309 RepID=A0A229NZV0_9BACL|nr:ArsR family transcriptional regulator [Paenibacillus herberti]